MSGVDWSLGVASAARSFGVPINGTVNGVNVRATSTSVGHFTTLLLDINPTYTLGGFPTDWQQYTVTFSGPTSPTNGSVGFRYFVENGGLLGDNSDYIGLDTVQIATVPEPSV